MLREAAAAAATSAPSPTQQHTQAIVAPSAQLDPLPLLVPEPEQAPRTQARQLKGPPATLSSPLSVGPPVTVAAKAFDTLVQLVVDEPENSIILDIACAVEQLGGNVVAAECLMGFSSDMMRNATTTQNAQRALAFARVLNETAENKPALFRYAEKYLQGPDTYHLQLGADVSPPPGAHVDDPGCAPESPAATTDPYMAGSPIKFSPAAQGTADGGGNVGVAADFWAGPQSYSLAGLASTAVPTPSGKRRKVMRALTESMYSDLRVARPPERPEMLLQMWRTLALRPLSSDTVTIFKFTAKGNDHRNLEWCWWSKLASAGILVRDMYCGTPYYKDAPAAALMGTPGQFVVKTVWGTVTLMIRAGRVQSQNAEPKLYRRLRVILPPFDTVGDQLALHRGRLPAAVRAHAGKQAADWSAVGFG